MVQYGPIISNFVLEVKLLLFQPWSPPTSARRLLVLRHGPSARLQGVAIVAEGLDAADDSELLRLFEDSAFTMRLHAQKTPNLIAFCPTAIVLLRLKFQSF